jgi:hypothetical protein
MSAIFILIFLLIIIIDARRRIGTCPLSHRGQNRDLSPVPFLAEIKPGGKPGRFLDL